MNVYVAIGGTVIERRSLPAAASRERALAGAPEFEEEELLTATAYPHLARFFEDDVLSPTEYPHLAPFFAQE